MITTDRRRLLELALQALETQQRRLQQDIVAIRTELGGKNFGRKFRLDDAFLQEQGVQDGRSAPNKGIKMSLAQKKKISNALKKRWAERRRQT